MNVGLSVSLSVACLCQHGARHRVDTQDIHVDLLIMYCYQKALRVPGGVPRALSELYGFGLCGFEANKSSSPQGLFGTEPVPSTTSLVMGSMSLAENVTVVLGQRPHSGRVPTD
jgi:hypothetical protein